MRTVFLSSLAFVIEKVKVVEVIKKTRRLSVEINKNIDQVNILSPLN